MTTQTEVAQPAPTVEVDSTQHVTAKSRPPVTLDVYRFTVDQYCAMANAGILKQVDKVELVDGVVTAMAPMGRNHRSAVNRYNRLFGERVNRRAIVQIQSSIFLDDHTMPEPDLALLNERSDFYDSSDAGPGDVLLVIEVSDSSVEYDRGEKLALYARFDIPEVWITVLPERIIEAHSEPVGGRYTLKRIFSPGDDISPACFPDISLAVSEIMPG